MKVSPKSKSTKLVALAVLFAAFVAVGWHFLTPAVQNYGASAEIRKNCPQDYPTFAATNFTHFDQITLKRTRCLALWCPTYTVTIHRNGKIEYQGEYAVKIKGTKTATATDRQMEKLLSALNDSGYFSIPDKFLRKKEDSPSCHHINASYEGPSAITSVTIDADTHQLHHDWGGPDQLTDFEEAIDKIIDSEQWIGTPKEREKLEPAFQ